MEIVAKSEAATPVAEYFHLTNACLDSKDNKYIAYTFQDRYNDKGGIVIEAKNQKPEFQEFNAGHSFFRTYNLKLAASKDESKVYMYCCYSTYPHDQFYEGIILASVNTTTLKMNTPQLYPYPDDYKQKNYKDDFGDKKKGFLTVVKSRCNFNEMDNGMVAITGYPDFSLSEYNSPSTGHIFAAFISKDNKATYSVLPRLQSGNAYSNLITVVKDNKLICFYTDVEKNVLADIKDKAKCCPAPANMVLAAAVFDSNGNLIERKKVADEPGGNICYIPNLYNKINDQSFMFPLGRQRVSLVKKYNEFTAIAFLSVQ